MINIVRWNWGWVWLCFHVRNLLFRVDKTLGDRRCIICHQLCWARFLDRNFLCYWLKISCFYYMLALKGLDLKIVKRNVVFFLLKLVLIILVVITQKESALGVDVFASISSIFLQKYAVRGLLTFFLFENHQHFGRVIRRVINKFSVFYWLNFSTWRWVTKRRATYHGLLFFRVFIWRGRGGLNHIYFVRRVAQAGWDHWVILLKFFTSLTSRMHWNNERWQLTRYLL